MAAKTNSTVSLASYHAVGFDLDNTLARYKIDSLVRMEYGHLARFLVEKKGYNRSLLDPIDQHIPFLRKGLVLDMERGNLVQLSPQGRVQKASHGTTMMSPSELDAVYKDGHWEVADLFVERPMDGFGGPLATRMRCFSDYFDMPSALASMRIVDAQDQKNGGRLDKYSFWPDVLEGLLDQFKREQFSPGAGGFFTDIKARPQDYYYKCSPELISWLRRVRKEKPTFMVTGSNADFANHTARFALGDHWEELFDVVVFFARKPGFFTGQRPFLQVDGLVETQQEVTILEKGGKYSQGNWSDLEDLLCSLSSGREDGGCHEEVPRCIYFGDHVGQDVMAPGRFSTCHSVAVCEESGAEAAQGHNYPDRHMLLSPIWGSYFSTNGGDDPTMWGHTIRTYSQLCIPNVESLVGVELEEKLPSFNGGRNPFGFHPSVPAGVRKAAHAKSSES